MITPGWVTKKAWSAFGWSSKSYGGLGSCSMYRRYSIWGSYETGNLIVFGRCSHLRFVVTLNAVLVGRVLASPASLILARM